jgi:GxxExxY protein
MGTAENQGRPQFDNDPISGAIIGAAIEVHRLLGPGLLESAYKSCLYYELAALDLKIDVERFLPITYKALQLPRAFRLDLIVEDAVIVELKSVEKILPVHEAQILTYLKLTGLKRGMILNFNVTLMKHGVRRLNLTKPSPFSPSSPV